MDQGVGFGGQSGGFGVDVDDEPRSHPVVGGGRTRQRPTQTPQPVGVGGQGFGGIGHPLIQGAGIIQTHRFRHPPQPNHEQGGAGAGHPDRDGGDTGGGVAVIHRNPASALLVPHPAHRPGIMAIDEHIDGVLQLVVRQAGPPGDRHRRYAVGVDAGQRLRVGDQDGALHHGGHDGGGDLTAKEQFSESGEPVAHRGADLQIPHGPAWRDAEGETDLGDHIIVFVDRPQRHVLLDRRQEGDGELGDRRQALRLRGRAHATPAHGGVDAGGRVTATA